MKVHGRVCALIGGTAVLLLTAAAPQRADAQTRVTDKWVTVVLAAEPEALDPCMTSKATQGRVARFNVVEPLIQQSSKDGSLMPRLATSWEQLDPSTWRIKLRQGVTFHDGSPFNAETAKKSLDREYSKPLACATQSKFFAGNDMTVTAVDEYTLQLKTSRPEPILPMRLTGLVISGPNTPVDKLVREPVGTGAYIFDSWQNGQQILLRRNDKYWGEKPQAEGVRYIWRNESSVRASMVKIGEADIALSIAPQDATDDKMDFSYLNSETSSLRVDTDRAPTNDVRVRLAMAYALDMNSMIGTVLPKSTIRATQMVIPNIPGHNHEIDKKPFAYDPAKAKQLLGEAKAGGTPVDKEMQFVIYPGQYPNAGELMEAYAAMLRAVGFNFKTITTDPGQYQEFNYKPFKADRPATILQSSHDNNFGDPVFTVFFKYGCDGQNSPFCNADFDKDVLRVSGLGGEARVKGWQEIFRYLYEDASPYIMMYHMVGFSRVGPRINFIPDVTTNGEIRAQEITFK